VSVTVVFAVVILSAFLMSNQGRDVSGMKRGTSDANVVVPKE
jgi:hypothetical protein